MLEDEEIQFKRYEWVRYLDIINTHPSTHIPENLSWVCSIKTIPALWIYRQKPLWDFTHDLILNFTKYYYGVESFSSNRTEPSDVWKCLPYLIWASYISDMIFSRLDSAERLFAKVYHSQSSPLVFVLNTLFSWK